MQLYRLMGILTLLLREGRLTAPRLAERFEVSPRTIRRDIEALCQAGVPVVTAQGHGGGISIAPGYRLDFSCLTHRELLAILAGVRGATSLLPGADAAGLLARLGHLPPPPPEVPDIDLGDFRGPWLSRLLETLSGAIRECRRVEIVYHAPGGTTRRRVEPCQLLYRYSAWYLSAWCLLRQDFRTFKLARMASVVPLQETFPSREIPPEKAPFGEYLTRERYTLLASFAPEAEYRLVEEYGEDSFCREADGRLLLRRGFAGYENLRQWVLSFGDAVRVLEPPELREDILRQAEKLVAYYQNRTPPCPVPDGRIAGKGVVTMPESRCGLLCSQCGYREQTGCPGCTQMERPFWGESCPVKSCCQGRGKAHCGECPDLPCDLLRQFAYDKEQGDGGERIRQCQRWAEEGESHGD